MMNRFQVLFQREFHNCLLATWILSAAAMLCQPLLYWIALQNFREETRFETVYLASAAPILLPVLLAGLTGWMVWITGRDLTNASIATLLMLPGSRNKIYLAKIAAFCSALLLVMAGILVGIGICYLFFLQWCADYAQMIGVDCRMTAGFWLGLVRTPLFRLLCPMTPKEICSTLLLLATLPVLGFYIGWRRSRRYIRAILLTAPTIFIWVYLLRFRLAENHLYPDWMPLAFSTALVLLLAFIVWDSFHAVRTGDF